MKHEGYTPGPWAIGGSMISNGKETIALMLRRPAVYGGKRYETRDTDAEAPETGKITDANARLIADAPRLAERVERLEACLVEIDEETRLSIAPAKSLSVIHEIIRAILAEGRQG